LRRRANNGLSVKSVAKGAAGSARYLYCDEISDLCSETQSLIVVPSTGDCSTNTPTATLASVCGW